MRCSGEIDITKTRWSEKPTIIIPMILNNIRDFEAGASKRKFEEGLQEALKRRRVSRSITRLAGWKTKSRRNEANDSQHP